MSAAFVLTTRAAAHDLSVLLGRAQRLDEAGAVRLIADSGVLAVYVAVVTPKGLLDRGPTVLGLRTLALAEGAFDEVVPIRSLLARVDAALAAAPDSEPTAPVPVGLPAGVSTIVWAGITPPRGGWQRLAPLEPAPFAAAARVGIEEIATAIPTGTGEQIVHRVRSEVWGRPLPEAEHLPAGAAFAFETLGFLGEDPVQQFAAGSWIRLSTARGHVLVKHSGWSLQR
ncbi:hypothetical protein [Microcella frigidaquae]|uniref:Uncharacterized protein n=1 Tax=Microcella frigidaquae TaxID=424758 RepID=A0A840XMM6_9MICO|nr:hypothetical protein [Microcella frigidaquae]MBB5617159.1 hypothetical protein [Microcella frigidaquae]NHN45139.1 hypothetical protein [Microcella frigidaquae]